jgi:hypothetical protein
MIGDSDRYDAVQAMMWESTEGLAPPPSPRPPALGSSSFPFEGGIKNLLKFIGGAERRHRDKTWDGSHVAENAKSDGEAEIHNTNGRIRLIVATETTREDCVALLMQLTSFSEIHHWMRQYRKVDMTLRDHDQKQREAHTASKDMRREIDNLEKELPKLQESDLAAAGTWRYKERLKALRPCYEENERLERKLEKSLRQKSESKAQICSNIAVLLEDVFMDANLLLRRKEEPDVYYSEEENPSPTVERPYTFIHEEEHLD